MRLLEVTFWSWKLVSQCYLMYNVVHDIHLWWRQASMDLYSTVVPGSLLMIVAYQEASGERTIGSLLWLSHWHSSTQFFWNMGSYATTKGLNETFNPTESCLPPSFPLLHLCPCLRLRRADGEGTHISSFTVRIPAPFSGGDCFPKEVPGRWQCKVCLKFSSQRLVSSNTLGREGHGFVASASNLISRSSAEISITASAAWWEDNGWSQGLGGRWLKGLGHMAEVKLGKAELLMAW